MTIIKEKKFYYAVATIVTTTVGIGIFGIPFSFVKAGFATGLLFLVIITAITLVKNLTYGEVVLRTKEQHQLIGYTEKYLGSFGKRIMSFSFILGTYGALLGVIVISGTFWANIFYFLDYSPFVFSLIFFAMASSVVLKGLRTVSRFDLALMIFFAVTIIVVASLGVGSIDVSNYKTVFFEEFWFLPFGVVLFSLAGLSSIPLAREIVKGREYMLKKVILWGTLIPAVFYLIFALIVSGVSGDITSPDGISGLGGFLGAKAVVIGSLLGLFSTFTVFINAATALKESFEQDFNIGKVKSWLMVTVPPLGLFLVGLRNFIEIIGLVGAFAVSIGSILSILTFIVSRKKGDRGPEYKAFAPAWLLYLIILIFGAGAVYSLTFF